MTLQRKPPKARRCKTCREQYQPARAMQMVCSAACATTLAKLERAKTVKRQEAAARKELRERKAKLLTRSDYVKAAQAAFNAYIRTRDAGKPCICCGLPLGAGDVGGYYDCGHYRSVGSAPGLRFHEANAHAQRKQCNRWGAGRAVDYRKGLIERIGMEAVEALEADQATRHYSIDDLKQIKATYSAKRRELEKA
jgi:hypothetical protein